MKMKKMVGALALSAALAMGTAPAFAASASDAAQNEFSTDGGNTVIKAQVKNIDENICATVPLNVVVVFGSQGHSKIIAPSASEYQITNTGKGDIKLTEGAIESGSNNTGITMDWMTAGAAETDPWVDKSGTAIANNAPRLMLTWGTTAGGSAFKTYLSDSHALSNATNADKVDSKYNPVYSDFAEWPTGGITIAKDTAIDIQLGGDVYNGGTALSLSESTDTLCKIKYTIAKA